MTKFFCTLIVFITFSTNSYAYIDPGSGSAILIGLLTALTTGLVFVKNFFSRVKNFFKNATSRIKNLSKNRREK